MDKKIKLTLDELIRRKEQIFRSKKREETAEIYVKTLDGNIIIRTPSNAIMSDVAEMPTEDVNKYIVYNCVISPSLKDSRLQQAYECREPMDIIDKLFLPGEAAQIAKKCMELAGIDEERVVTVKN